MQQTHVEDRTNYYRHTQDYIRHMYDAVLILLNIATAKIELNYRSEVKTMVDYLTTHFPSLWHSTPSQSSKLISKLAPVNPASHWQV